MSYKVAIQVVSKDEAIPTKQMLRDWAKAALSPFVADAELTIRIVDESESAKLNSSYRNKSTPTNVLAFPFADAKELGLNLLGDIVICAPVVVREAAAEHKETVAHFAHMVVHGCLHLLGYDHIEDSEALVMEKQESNILKQCGFPDPYAEATKDYV